MKPTIPRHKSATVLLIEDTASLQLIYRTVLQGAGYQVRVAGSEAEGMASFVEAPSQVVMLDLGLPDRDGLDLIQELLTLRAETRIIVITANGSINKAVEAMRAGAHEILVKPFDESRFLNAVSYALQTAAVPRPPTRMPSGRSEIAPMPRTFLGSSEIMARVQSKIASVATSMATVFITGESGTGKELCALAVHGRSGRAKGPFIALNCGAIPHDLLESEVFGHVKGSFTGAIADRPGAATAADGGTLFLDEICEMAPALQTKLLRFLQTSTVTPVGSNRPQKVNIRIICATNRDPLEAVRRGNFREDLYYRLFVVPIHMPPLRDRGRDVIEIAQSALHHFAEEEGREFVGLSPEVVELFCRLRWPGNVRQVLNVIRNVVVLNDGGVVTLSMLPADLANENEAHPSISKAQIPEKSEPELKDLLGRPLSEVERIIVQATLARYGGSVPKAARVLELSPSTLYRKLASWSKNHAS